MHVSILCVCRPICTYVYMYACMYLCIRKLCRLLSIRLAVLHELALHEICKSNGYISQRLIYRARWI